MQKHHQNGRIQGISAGTGGILSAIDNRAAAAPASFAVMAGVLRPIRLYDGGLRACRWRQKKPESVERCAAGTRTGYAATNGALFLNDDLPAFTHKSMN